jgi:SAM-dependent methyltransferase
VSRPALESGRPFKSLLHAAYRTVLPKMLRMDVWNIRRWIRERGDEWSRQIPVGLVRFGSLRRLRPIAPDFGWRWGQIIDRYYIEAFLSEHCSDIRGRVLEVSERLFTVKFGGDRVIHSDILHVKQGYAGATIVADLTRADHIPSETFDCIILTQTLQFIFDTRAAIRTLYRILKPGGVLLLTCHGISQIARYDMDNWGEYWRFTTLSAGLLFTEVFPKSQVTIQAYGNVFAATAFLHGLVTEELQHSDLDFKDPDYEVLVAVRAVRPQPNYADA